MKKLMLMLLVSKMNMKNEYEEAYYVNVISFKNIICVCSLGILGGGGVPKALKKIYNELTLYNH